MNHHRKRLRLRKLRRQATGGRAPLPAGPPDRAAERSTGARRGRFETVVSVATVIALFGTLAVIWRQTDVFKDQAETAARQAGIATRQADIAQATAETSFNLAIMERLDRVLLEIADRPRVHRVIWQPSGGCQQNNGEVQVLADSLIDVLELSLMAVDRLPGFSKNDDDWHAYFDQVYGESGCVRSQIRATPRFWPYIEQYLMERVLARRHDHGDRPVRSLG